MNSITKKCSRCGFVKPGDEFSKAKRTKDGLRSWCRACSAIYTKQWRSDHPEKVKENKRKSYLKNREQSNLRVRRHYWKHHEKEIERQRCRSKTEAERERKKKWSLDNALKAAQSKKNWHDNHIEQVRKRIREYARKMRLEHPEKQRAANKKFFAKHPEVQRIYIQNRRAKQKANGGTVTQEEWNEILEKYSHKCLCCGRSDVKLTMDHVFPIVLGGKHTKENIQPLCKSCNSRKHDKHIDYR
jgi:5-methylcytosine-specific restriction endonuclease McrA